MPRYVIERQYLVAVYEHILIESPTLGDACLRARDDIEEPWGDDARTDYESAGETTIQRAVEVPDSMQIAEWSLAGLLYEAGLDPLTIPGEPPNDESIGTDVGFV